MKLIFLILTIAICATSFKQFAKDWKKCGVDYFCLVPPSCASLSQSQDETLLVEVTTKVQEDTNQCKSVDKAVIIKPRSPKEWLVFLYAANTGDTSELNLVFENKANSKLQTLIFGCARNGEHPYSKPPVKNTIEIHETVILNDGKSLECTGIVKSADIDLSAQLNAYDPDTYEVDLFHTTEILLNNKMTSVPLGLQFKNYAKNTWNQIMEKFGKCLIAHLHPPSTKNEDLIRTHDFREVEISSDITKCPQNLIHKPSASHDLIIQMTPRSPFQVIDSISCEGNALFAYHNASNKEDITHDVVVACGELRECGPKPPPALDCETCAAEAPQCVDPAKCKTLKCPEDHWSIDGNLYVGEVSCMKESREEGSDVDWFYHKNNQMIRVQTASCYREENCQVKNPLPFTPDKTKNSFKPSYNKSHMYCPEFYKLKYQTVWEGNTFDNIPESLECNKESGDWKNLDAVIRSKATNFLCEFAEQSYQSQISDEDKESDIIEIIIYPLAAVTIIIIIVDIVLAVIYSRKRKRRAKEMAVSDTKTGTDPSKWTKKALYNRRQPTTKVLKPDLSIYAADITNKTLLDDWPLYSMRERIKFLENTAVQFGAYKSRIYPPFVALFSRFIDEMDPTMLKMVLSSLKVLVYAYTINENVYMAQKVRDIFAPIAQCIFARTEWAKQDKEEDNITACRGLAYNAMVFTDDAENIKTLLQMYNENPENLEPAIRKYIWTVAVREADKFEEIQNMLQREITKTRGPLTAEERKFGTKVEHLIYALCSHWDRTRIENFFNYILKEPYYRGRDIVSGFSALTEDAIQHDNYSLARFMFTERHKYIITKMAVTSDNYRKLFEMSYRFLSYNLLVDLWITKHVATFAPADKKRLDLVAAATYYEYYCKPPHETQAEMMFLSELKAACRKAPEEKPEVKALENNLL